jgi:ABC-type branched-subunit amino acid transport system ATPase component
MKHIDPILEARGLSFEIGNASIVDGFEFQVAPGQVLGLIGPNGAGKTTVLDLLTGFIKPCAGAVLLNGREVTRLRPYRRAALGVARTFQESPAISDLTVREHLLLARENAGRRRASRAARSPDELLEMFHLTHRGDVRGAELPAAQRRLLDVARALATAPSVLLLDEPFAGLANDDQELLFAQLRRLRSEGIAILIVEHRLGLLHRIADTALVLVRGRPIAQGSVATVLRNPEVQQAYLGPGHIGKVTR